MKLKEGYDHKYLSILAIFRPYRSKNAFAQIVGRVLRAIPEDEIRDFAIDNNACIIYHKETGLDELWEDFSKEVDRSKKYAVREYPFSDKEYVRRKIYYADIEADDPYLGITESYLEEIDFNQMFEKARKNIEENVQEKVDQIKSADVNLDEDDLNEIRNVLRKKEIHKKKNEIDVLLIEKRPEQARQKLRDILVKEANEGALRILENKGIDPKSNSLYNKFKNQVKYLKPNTPNDGILVMYINLKLYNNFGPVKERDLNRLLSSQKYIEKVLEEIRRMI